MDPKSERWRQITPSDFAWEREALAYLQAGLPDCEPYRVWANFEFIADDGSVYEVDALVLTSTGFWFVEIKSWPGPVTGDSHTWAWHPQDGRSVRHYDNPIRLANAKSKKLRSLLQRQRALKKLDLPFLEARIFLSHEKVQPNFDTLGGKHVCVRDRQAGPQGAYPGIIATLKGTDAASAERLGRRNWRRVNTPLAKAITQAMSQAGIRPSNRARRVGQDWLLGDLLEDGPGWQDFLAKHQGYKDKEVVARVRVFGVGQKGITPPRESLERAARREYEALRNLPAHPGILRPERFTDSERGPALIFPHDSGAVRFDHFLEAKGEQLAVDERLTFLRRLAETVAWAHEHQLIHRALSPQNILVRQAEQGPPTLQVINWQTVSWANDTAVSRTRTGTSHPEALVEEPSLVYMAPEARNASSGSPAGAGADVFSLGAIAYRLFAGKPPATDVLDLTQKIREGEGLQLAAVVDGVVPSLVELVAWSTHPSVSDRLLDSARDFLDHLEKVEDELTQPDEAFAEPLQATKGDRLEGGFRVEKVLGTGSTAIAFRVSRDGSRHVLKVALSHDQNERLREEADVLRQIAHKRVVGLAETVQISDRVGILLDSAGGDTLRERLRKDGRLTRELLQRFGEDLLEAVDYLDQNGFAHRDIKPDNLAVVPDRTKALRLVLFDFSLARAPRENTRVGTPPYLDPFLPDRGAWDGYAERWSAAVTLYEMASNALPRWGDGKSDPASIKDEATIESDLFEASLRAGLTQFFARALKRKAKQRFDNALEMRRAWRQLFEDADRASDGQDAFDEEAFVRALPKATLDSPVTALPFGLRSQEALERLGATTLREAAAIPKSKIAILRGLGHRTRRDLLAATGLLSEAFAGAEPPAPPPPPKKPPKRGKKRAGEPVVLMGVDVLAAQLVPERTGSRGRPATEATRKAQRLWVGLDPLPQLEGRWPDFDDVRQVVDLQRSQVKTAVDRGLKRWAKSGPLREVRQELAQYLGELGAATTKELEEALLSRRGSSAAEPRRSREAGAVVRAALEAELLEDEPRWAFRRATQVVLAAVEGDDPEQAESTLDYLERLGREADRLAEAEPLPAPQRVEAALRQVDRPAGCPSFPPERLVRLAASASERAAASSRLELYPQGLDAARALQLAAGAIAGVRKLEPEDLRRRVELRYPAADPLPNDPAQLTKVISAAGVDLSWSDEENAYLQRTLITLGLSSHTRSGPPRLDTAQAGLARAPKGELSPEEADARMLEQRLARSARDGGFLVLLAAPHQLERAAGELLRFGPKRVSLEERVLSHLREICQQRRVNWERVIEADAAGPRGGKLWSRLTTLMRQALEALHADLLRTPGVLLLTEVGVLGRYERVDFLGRLRSALDSRTASADTALEGAWVLTPDSGQHEGPVIDSEPIAVLGRAQWTRLSTTWLENRHRAATEAPEESRT